MLLLQSLLEETGRHGLVLHLALLRDRGHDWLFIAGLALLQRSLRSRSHRHRFISLHAYHRRLSLHGLSLRLVARCLDSRLRRLGLQLNAVSLSLPMTLLCDRLHLQAHNALRQHNSGPSGRLRRRHRIHSLLRLLRLLSVMLDLLLLHHNLLLHGGHLGLLRVLMGTTTTTTLASVGQLVNYKWLRHEIVRKRLLFTVLIFLLHLRLIRVLIVLPIVIDGDLVLTLAQRGQLDD